MRNQVRRLLAAALVAIAAGAVTAAAATARSQTSVEGVAHALVARGLAPGAAAFAKAGDRTSTTAAGVSDLETREPLRPDARVRVGSTTKTMTAVVVLQLVQEGRFQLDEDAHSLLPGLLPDGPPITIRELLNHTSGLFNYTRDPGVRATWGTDDVPGPLELVQIAAAYGLDFDPGTAWEYSNTNYQVLGLIVEKVTGESLAGELSRRIFVPLGLRATALDPGRDISGPHAHGYYLYRDAPPIDETRTTFGAWADGGVVSNARDLGRFYSALFQGRLLSPRMMSELETTVETGGFPDGDEAGLGLFRTTLRCGDAWSMSGGSAGFLAKVLVSGDGSRVVAFVTNGFLDDGPETQQALDSGAADAFCRQVVAGRG